MLRNAVIFYIGLTVVAYLSARQQFILINRAGEGFLRDLRVRVFDHIQKQSLAFFDRNKSGVLVARMTADIESMGELVQWGLLQFVAAIMLVGFALIAAFLASWQLALVGLLVMPVIIVASRKFQRDSNAAYLDVRENIGQNLSALQEGIAGVRVIQAYGRESEQQRRFKQSNRDLYDSHVHSVRVSTWYFGLVETAGVMATALIVGVGGWLYSRGDVDVGQIVTVVLLYAQLFEPVQQLSQLYNTVQSSAASLNKLFGILDTEPDVDDGTEELPRTGSMVVDRVGFRYPDDRGGGAERRVDHRRRRRAAGARRADRRRQVDARQADGPVVRPHRGHDHVRWHRPARRDARLPATSRGRGAPGGLPVRRNHRRQRSHRSCRRDRRRGSRRVRGNRRTRAVRGVRRRHPHRGPRARVPAVGW